MTQWLTLRIVEREVEKKKAIKEYHYKRSLCIVTLNLVIML